jgi:biotin carboxyl carrier protein
LRYEVEIQGRVRQIVLESMGDGFAVAVDGRARHVQAARSDAQTLSLIVGEVLPKGDTAQPSASTSRVARSYEAVVAPERDPASLTIFVGATAVPVMIDGWRRRRHTSTAAVEGPQRLLAAMPGKVVRLLVKPGDRVKGGQPLVVVEAMKMENELRAGRSGTITEIYVKEGASVEAGSQLVVIE